MTVRYGVGSVNRRTMVVVARGVFDVPIEWIPSDQSGAEVGEQGGWGGERSESERKDPTEERRALPGRLHLFPTEGFG